MTPFIRAFGACMHTCLPGVLQSQAKIAQMIQQEAIDQNYSMAMEEAPEVFARVMMLYIDTEVNAARRSGFFCASTILNFVYVH